MRFYTTFTLQENSYNCITRSMASYKEYYHKTQLNGAQSVKCQQTEAATRGVLWKKGVLKNFAKFTEKHLYQSLFFNNVPGLKPATSLKKRLWHVFSCGFCKNFRNTFLREHLWKTASEQTVSLIHSRQMLPIYTPDNI